MGVDVDIFLVGMLASTLWWHVHHGSLKEFEQSLLHALTAHVAGDRRVVGLTRDFVDLVDEDDAPLGSLHIIVGHLEQSGEDALHVLTHISGLGEDGGIDDGEGNVEKFGYRACEQCLSRTGAPHHDDIALLYLHPIGIVGLLESFVVVVNGNGEITLGLILPDDILVEIVFYLFGFGHLLDFELLFRACGSRRQNARGLDDLVGLLRAVLADEAIDARDEQSDIFLPASAEATYFLHLTSSV